MSRARQAAPGRRRGSTAGWTRAGVAVVAAMVTILSGCGQSGPSEPRGASTSEGAADSARTNGSSSGPTKDKDQSKAPSPTSSTEATKRSAGKAADPSSGERSKTSPRKDAGAREGPTGEPTLEPRPEADLSDKQIPKIYSDDVAPGRQVTVTLCNLTQGHLEVLEKHTVGQDGVDDSNLRLALISLGDLLDVWEGLTWDFPKAADDIDTARDVYASWDLALALRESGDPAGAQEQLDAASKAIDRLPEDPAVNRGCGR